jgi:Arv1-like family
MAYRCVYCLSPATALWYRSGEGGSSSGVAVPVVTTSSSSSTSNIKLKPCAACHQNVDPYIEREWLLVVLDLILLRLPAYRHVMANYFDYYYYNSSFETRDETTTLWKFPLLVLAVPVACLFQALLVMPWTRDHDASNDPLLVVSMMLFLVLRTVALACGITVGLAMFHWPWTSGGMIAPFPLLYTVLPSVVIPALVGFATTELVTVLWHNSSQDATMPVLGHVLVTLYQFVTLSVAISLRLYNQSFPTSATRWLYYFPWIVASFSFINGIAAKHLLLSVLPRILSGLPAKASWWISSSSRPDLVIQTACQDALQQSTNTLQVRILISNLLKCFLT